MNYCLVHLNSLQVTSFSLLQCKTDRGSEEAEGTTRFMNGIYDCWLNANILFYSQSFSCLVQFTDEEKDQLRRLPNKDYIL